MASRTFIPNHPGSFTTVISPEIIARANADVAAYVSQRRNAKPRPGEYPIDWDLLSKIDVCFARELRKHFPEALLCDLREWCKRTGNPDPVFARCNPNFFLKTGPMAGGTYCDDDYSVLNGTISRVGRYYIYPQHRVFEQYVSMSGLD